MATRAEGGRKDAILAVATRLFAERGYAGVSVKDVADGAGLGKASLFHHFPNKDELYEAVLDEAVSSFGGLLSAVYGAEGSFAERLDTLTSTLLDAFAARPEVARLLLREAMDFGPPMRGALGDKLLMVLEAGAGWLRAGQEEGSFVAADARHLVLTSLGMHVLPFALGELVARYAGTASGGVGFVEARRAELLAQARRLHLPPAAPRKRAAPRR